MTGPTTEDVIYVPIDLVCKSPGLSLDIGCSVGKLAYRSNKDFKNGEPLGELVDPKKGRIHVALFPREDIDDMIKFMKENCDLKRNADGCVTIPATGAGGASYCKMIEEELNCKIQILSEFDMFVKAFIAMREIVPKEDFLHSIPAATKATAEKEVEVLNHEISIFSLNPSEATKVWAEAEAGEADGYPCIMAMCGSGTGFLVIRKDGTFDFAVATCLAGRLFLGTMALMTGERNYSRLMEMAEGSDGRSVDSWVSDLDLSSDDKRDQGLYTINEDSRAFPFGKACNTDRAQIKDGDIVWSMQKTLGQAHAQLGHLVARSRNMTSVFFCGNFVDNEAMRGHIFTENMWMSAFTRQSVPVDVHFVRHGGVFGALGGLLFDLDSAAPDSAAPDSAEQGTPAPPGEISDPKTEQDTDTVREH